MQYGSYLEYGTLSEVRLCEVLMNGNHLPCGRQSAFSLENQIGFDDSEPS